MTTSIELSFFARSAPERWQEAVTSLGCPLTPMTGTSESPLWWKTAFTALPDVLAPGTNFLLGEVHSMAQDPEETHWVLRMTPVPSPTPPPEIFDSSRAVGGYPGVLQRLVHAWPTSKLVKVDSKITFVFDETRWQSPFAPKKRMALQPLTQNNYQASLSFESYSWKITPSSPIEEIVDLGYIKPGHFGITCSGTESLELDTNIFSRVETASWTFMSGFLRAKNRKRRPPKK